MWKEIGIYGLFSKSGSRGYPPLTLYAGHIYGPRRAVPLFGTTVSKIPHIVFRSSCAFFFFFNVALRPKRPNGLLGTATSTFIQVLTSDTQVLTSDTQVLSSDTQVLTSDTQVLTSESSAPDLATCAFGWAPLEMFVSMETMLQVRLCPALRHLLGERDVNPPEGYQIPAI